MPFCLSLLNIHLFYRLTLKSPQQRKDRIEKGSFIFFEKENLPLIFLTVKETLLNFFIPLFQLSQVATYILSSALFF